MAKKIEKQKGSVSTIKVTVERPKVPKRSAPGNPQKLNRGNQHAKKDEHGCTEKERAFVEFYTMTWNLSEAVRNAGFECINPGSYGGELMKKPHIKEFVETRRKEFRERNEDIRDRLTAALEESAFSDYSKYVTLEEQVKKVRGKDVTIVVPVINVKKIMEDGNGKIINSIKVGKFNTIEIKLDDRMAAREMLARHIGYNEVDNAQKRSSAVEIYMPDNGRGDVILPKPGEIRTESDEPGGYGKDMK